LADVANGDEVVIAKAGHPIARLVSIRQPVRKRAFGKDAGLFEIPEDFDSPLPDDVISTFEV
jgi:antitoxin (DNA-binding transcriptional repressor) of toxin-antitoxin stability system